jgi:polar amino acid transport system substrate-binding protein
VTEVIAAAFKRAGHETTIDWYPWNRAFKMVEFGGADVVMGAYYSEERTGKYTLVCLFFRLMLDYSFKRLGD